MLRLGMTNSVFDKISNREQVSRIWKFDGGQAELPLIFEDGQFFLKGNFEISASSALSATGDQVPYSFAFSSNDLLLHDCYFADGNRTYSTKDSQQIWDGRISVGRGMRSRKSNLIDRIG